MNWHIAIGILSSAALLIPAVIILFYGLIKRRSYLALFIYCSLSFVYNLMTENFLVVPRNFERNFGLCINVLDVPLMLTFLMMFSTSIAQRQRMKIYLAVYAGFELVVLSIYGLTFKTVTIIMGPGLLLILAISSYMFFLKMRQSIIHKKALGKALITAAILFAYGCFGIIYVMHYLIELQDVPNIFLIYFIVTIIYCSVLSIGLVIENKRIKKLDELLVTRKELHRFFAEEKKPASPGKSPEGKWELN